MVLSDNYRGGDEAHENADDDPTAADDDFGSSLLWLLSHMLITTSRLHDA